MLEIKLKDYMQNKFKVGDKVFIVTGIMKWETHLLGKIINIINDNIFIQFLNPPSGHREKFKESEGWGFNQERLIKSNKLIERIYKK